MEEMPQWFTLSLLAALLIVTVVVRFFIAEPLDGWLVPRARGRRGGAAARTAVLHLGLCVWLAGFTAAAAAVRDLAGPTTWAAGALTLVAVLPAAPVTAHFLPSSAGSLPRAGLTAAGMTKGEAHATRWVGLPFAVIEVVLGLAGGFLALAP
ncbi:hypothetical protein [Janibacter cremeus]|uniref:Uncharacterized protein n=1 Tax=Janibacter cremeus TaxID=1285192 RepID=A0A852VVW8_9MICO|nr:hypothetical protein [Janibacter cremeus]NYF97905.1 hypothetical protein [Janibacter cremeus]